ncbi:nitrite reductase small subunit NirD [Bacillus gobiensis]|nr:MULTISPECIES: nitrite reductase small subunit NirD [Bacillus]MBP1082378.1 nitrite reductase (NADH) small subunit [Bacillus capparidis]MED1097363.1 nitrite reductase small subunit NirD [Bacillus capparidis]
MGVKTQVKVGVVNDFVVDVGKVVEVQGIALAVFRLSNGRFKAVENRCPHKEGPLAEGIVSGEFVFCPLHDWKIDLEGGQVQAPDHGCVKTYKVAVEGDDVYILT